MRKSLLTSFHHLTCVNTNCFFAHRALSIGSSAQNFQENAITRNLGQPTAYTHPFLLNKGEVTPGLTKEDYEERRSALIRIINAVSKKQKNDKEEKGNVVILFGEPIKYMSEDIPYPFHQNTNFRYLTGFLEPDSCLILDSRSVEESSTHKSTLLVQERDSHKELWHGARAGTDGAVEHTGIDHAEGMQHLSNILKKYLSENYDIWYDFQRPTNLELHMNHMRSFLTDAFKKKLKIRSINDAIHQQRHIKTNKEIVLMMEAGRITAEAFKQTIPFSSPDINEGTVQALLDCECRVRGAQMLAYPPVVAGGNRANTLHYIFNNQRIKDGELVLVDAGAEYHGYVADITRTWPVNGKFSPAQRTLYEAVLKTQRACISLCKPGNTLDQIYNAMAMLIVQELMANKIIKRKPKGHETYEVARKYCPHHVSHWLGMDVHDTQCVPRSIPLTPGMVVTVEPGIYIREDDIDVSEEYRGIGIRIEDDVAVTSDGPLVLTGACPKDVDEIELLMSNT
ncbi:xaa-Pro aminopeptidase 3-like isoform X1 [Clavelina lepadiformis]|uniref:xaa-Pro aminopeptidase 3-like isoform X1 n=1 Tax=Clavelina lepadiformis TaxID=159417 RepID=UPI004041A8E4